MQQPGFPSLAEYYGGSGGNFAQFMGNWYDSVDGSDAWDDMSKESRANVMNAFLTQYNNEYNAHQAQLAWEREQEAIRRQNEYNSPVNQMARYAEAGLNPGAIYGQIGNGNQSGVAQYQPQRAESMKFEGDPRGTREQKLQQAQDIIGLATGVIKQITSALGDIQGVRNMSLQNDLLSAQLPFEKAIAGFRRGLLTNPDPDHSLDWDKMFDIAFPKYNASQLAGSRTSYQDWWNDVIAPLYQGVMSGKSVQAQTAGQISTYNQELLNSIPAELRGIVSFVLQLVQGLAPLKQ